MKTDEMRKLSQQLRQKAAAKKYQKIANTAHTVSAMLGLEHFKRILSIPPRHPR